MHRNARFAEGPGVTGWIKGSDVQNIWYPGNHAGHCDAKAADDTVPGEGAIRTGKAGESRLATRLACWPLKPNQRLPSEQGDDCWLLAVTVQIDELRNSVCRLIQLA